ncbi:MAG: CAP domain-containing protein [Fimbriimonadaceae bacterium]|nr:CAP domain-containing protein [Fimbriimonadaceae bacterium]
MFTTAVVALVGMCQLVGGADDASAEVVVLTNLERAKVGLGPLKVGTHETESAKWLSEDMGNADTARHIDSLGRGFAERAAAFEIQIPLGENYAAGFRTSQQLVTAWLGSPKHRANMLAPDAKLIGVGHAVRPKGLRNYWTMVVADFDDCVAVIDNEAVETSRGEVSVYVRGRPTSQHARLSNDGDTWSQWLPLGKPLPWKLSEGPGLKTVLVEVEDVTGKMARASDTIVLR